MAIVDCPRETTRAAIGLEVRVGFDTSNAVARDRGVRRAAHAACLRLAETTALEPLDEIGRTRPWGHDVRRHLEVGRSLMDARYGRGANTIALIDRGSRG